MSLLTLVRHGQASFGGPSYDQLSALGVEQSRLLGQAWAAQGIQFDQVYVGPLRRHQQTYDAAAAAYREHGGAWPDPVPLPQLNEHTGMLVLEQQLPTLIDQDPAVREMVTRHRQGDQEASRDYLKLFQRITQQWAWGELDAPGLEPWAAFRQRVGDGLRHIVETDTGGSSSVAFTSGGAVAAITGHVLELDDAQIMELSWIVRNASCTDLLFSRDRVSLHTFNATPGLVRSELLTYV